MIGRFVLAWFLASVPAAALLVLALKAGAQRDAREPQLTPTRVGHVAARHGVALADLDLRDRDPGGTTGAPSGSAESAGAGGMRI